MHEAQQHKKTSFVTLTYNDNNLPPTPADEFAKPHRPPGRSPGSGRRTDSATQYSYAPANGESQAPLSRRDLQLFTKRLHMAVVRKSGEGVRYFACGEYGETTGRPHYHIAIFGENFSDDRYFWKSTRAGHPLYRSSRLAALWNKGDADIGELTFESAAYIARYITKKITGEKAIEHYRRETPEGKEYWLPPEFSVMSRRPGIGRTWIDTFKTSVYPHDRVVINERAAKPPRYYDQQLPEFELAAVKAARAAKIRPENNSPARRRAGEAIQRAQLKKRALER